MVRILYIQQEKLQMNNMYIFNINKNGIRLFNEELNFTKKILVYYIPFGIIVNIILSYIYTNGFRSNSKSILFHLLLGILFIVFAIIIPLLKRINLWSKIIYQIRIDESSVVFKFYNNLNINNLKEITTEIGNFKISDGIRTHNKTILSKEDYNILKLENGKEAYLIESFWDDYSEIVKKLNHENSTIPN